MTENTGIDFGRFMVGEWLVEPALNAVTRDGEQTRLEPKVMQVLVCLAMHAGEVVSKEELISAVWTGTFVGDQVLTNAVWQLRQAMGQDKDKAFIQTVPKTGYRLVAKVGPYREPEAPAVERPPAMNGREVVPDDAGGPMTAAVDHPSEAVSASALPISHGRKRGRLLRRWRGFAAAVLIAIVAVGAMYGWIKRASASQSKRIMLAVLPFTNLSQDASQEYFSDGMTEEMILQLASLQPERLGVISRGSAMTYKHTGKRVDQIGSELGVDYVLEGSVRKEGNRIRVTAQLIDVKTQAQVWGENYEQFLKDTLLVQSDVARSVAQQIRLHLSPQQQARISVPDTTNPEARDAYYRGVFFFRKFTAPDVKKAMEHFQRAVELDPSYAQAQVDIADSYFVLAQPLRLTSGMRSQDAMAACKEAARKAIAMNDQLGEAHGLLAIALLFNDWDWKGSGAEFERALQLDPNSSAMHLYYALYLTLLRRHAEAEPHIERGLQLNPLSLSLRALAGDLYLNAGKYDRALAEARKTLELDPNFTYAHFVMANAYSAMGDGEKAVAAYERRLALLGDHRETIAGIHTAFTTEGMLGLYRALLRFNQEAAKSRRASPFGMAVYYARLGNNNQALACLEETYNQHDSSLLYINVNPALQSLRSEPRFQALLRRMQFPSS